MAKNFRNRNNESSWAVKDENGNLLVEPEDIAYRWREYFDTLLIAGNDLHPDDMFT